jgi:hypothetical protein
MVLFCTVVFASIYSGLLRSVFGDTVLIRTLSLSALPTSLIEPGCGWYQYAIYDYLSGILIYFLVMVIGLFVVKKKGIVYDW